MLNINDIRSIYPEYNDLTDYELSTAIHRKRYPNMSYEQFAQAFGGPLEEDSSIMQARAYNAKHPDSPIRPEDIGQGSFADDIGHSFAAGLNDLAALPFWAAEKGLEAAGADWMADKARAAKEYFGQSAEEKRQGFSADMKLAREKEFISEGEIGEYGLGDAWSDPRAVGGMIAESLPSMGVSMIGAAGVANTLVKMGMSRPLAWGIGSSVGEGSVAGAQNSMSAYDAVMQMPETTLEQAPEYQALLQKMEPAQARKALANEIAGNTAWQTGLSTGMLSAPAGALFGKVLGGEVGKNMLRTMGKQATAEGLEETLQSGAEHYLQQGQLQRADSSIDPMRGLANAAVAGGVAGAFMGAGMGGAGHFLGRKAQQIAPQNPVQPPSEPLIAEKPDSEAYTAPFLPEDSEDLTDWLKETEAKVEAEFGPEFGPEIIKDKTVDLLDWTAAEVDAVSPYAALPVGTTPPQRMLPVAGLSGAFALPQQTGQNMPPAVSTSIPMQGEPTGLGPIAPPTDFSNPIPQSVGRQPLALPMQPMAGVNPGLWSGGRSQLAYGPKPVPAPSQPVAPIPAAQQILNVQPTPRADTTVQAQALGIPAPDPMPAASALGAGASAPAVPGVPTMPQNSASDLAPVVQVPVMSQARSVLSAQPEQTATTVPNTRSAMLAQVSSENRQFAKKLERKPLARLVETEQAPEPFSNVEWTREDYPLPTAQGGTVFTSGSGRKMTPFPVVDYSTPGKRKASNAKAAAWLLDEARKEAAGNQSFMRHLNSLTPTNLPPAMVNELGEVLTNGAPEEAPRILKPLSDPVQHTADTQIKPSEAQAQPERNAQTPAKQTAQEDYPKPKWSYALPSFVTAQYNGGHDVEQKSATPASASKVSVMAPVSFADLSEHFARKLQEGAKYANIGQARRESFELTGKRLVSGTNDVKALDEAVELGVVRAARAIIADMRGKGASDVDIFRRLVDLYHQQPNLGVRTSTSVAQQAYSTPAPLAFLASHLAGITDTTTVYEPAAGNGMLIMEVNPKKAVVNELNADRAARLRSLGFTVTEEDAATLDPGKAVDVVIANPPFGRVRDDNRNPVSWTVAGYETKELDHAIVLKALEALQPEGRAVLIVGGKQGSDETRANKYQAAMQRQFYRALFDNYKVVDHFTVDGKLYERQGAGYPVDFIVIGGKGRTEGRKFPAADLPRIYNSFEALEGVIHEHRPQIHTGMDAAGRRGATDSSVRGRSGDQGRGGSHGAAVSVDSAHDSDSGSGRRGSGRREHGEAALPGGDVQPGSGRESAGEGGLSTDRHAADLRRQLPGTPHEHDGGTRRGVSEQNGGRQGNTGLSVESDAGRVGGTDAHSVSGRELVSKTQEGTSKAASKPQKANAQKATAHQEPYTPRSEAASMGTLVPRNMASPLKSALEKLEKRRGEIDGYVAKELGYSHAALKKHFAGEQIDAIGLAIDNISQGSGFIIGDQTGIGKGRVNAAIIRYARQKGLIPVFITMKPDLYADMIRDLNDIGESDFNPLPTNAGLTGEKAIPLPDGRKLRTGTAVKHEALLQQAAANGVTDYGAVFTTYDQLNTVNSADTHRREFMRAIAPNALFILDESHNAGGSESGKTRKAKNAAPSRAEFIREILAASPYGAFYSSATYAKRPDVMSLYFKTDMRHAVDDIGKLAEAVSAGGIPLQQVVAAQLTESGQYIRRERSFEGASVEVTHAEAKLEHAEQSATIMRTILAFDTLKQKAMEAVKQDARGEGEDVGDSSATGEKGANSTNFTSIMHNLIGQSLLAMKAKAAADEAALAVERGEKPVLTLANTMGSFIEEHVRGNGVQAGEELNLSFKDLFRRYLQKTRTLTKKDSSGKKVIESRLLTDKELGEEGVAAYNEVLQIIDGSVFDELPISPIDFITAELEHRGITVGEITGRTHAVEYRDGVPHYRARKTSSAQNIETMRRFNNGELDTMILNQSGSTGISLHSSSTFTDQRRRTMIIVQPELNIDVFMQTLGRVFRTGQVVPPSYKLLTSDIPAEKRPAAVLGKKMAGLNANTTASRTTDTTFQNIPDFLNEYGDIVTAQIMADEPELHAALGNPLSADSKGLAREDAVRKVTGRIPMLPLKEQQALYERIESDYKELIAQLEATGGSALEAKTLPLDARLVESSELTPAREDVATDSPFAAESRLGLFDVKVLGKPYTPDHVTAMVEKGKDGAPEGEIVRKETLEWLQNKLASMENEEARDNLKERVGGQFSTVREIFTGLPVGTPVLLNTTEASFEGIVTRHDYKGKGNPSAPSAWRMTVAVADAAKQITVPYSKIVFDGAGEMSVGGAFIRPHPKSLDEVLEKFAAGQSVKREKRYIAFGNVLAAYASVGSQGQVINFEDSDGNVRAGILYKKDASRDAILGTSAVSFPDFEAISAFFAATERKGIVKSADGNLVLAANGDQFKFSVPASKAKGAQFFLNGKLLEAAGRDFVKSGNLMGLTVDQATTAKMVGVLREQGFGLVAGSHKEEARTVMGMDDKPLASLAHKPRSDDTSVRVVDVDPGIVPEFDKVQDLVAWLKDYYADRKSITIKATGREVVFSNRGLKESAKRRGDAQRKAYAGLDSLVEEAAYAGFEEADARHRNVAGQEVYYAATRLGEKLYSVKFKLDVPLLGDSLSYKDHKATEIEIAPVLSAANGVETTRSQPGASAIREVSLGVLRGAVKPSSMENGVLSSLSPGKFLPPRREIRQRLRTAGVRRVADALARRAKNAVPTRVVGTFNELPARLRREFAEQADLVEGVYYDGTVWLVAENLTDEGRTADVWAHEQVVHGGLRSLFGKDGVDRLLRRLWESVGGMGNADVAEIARRYGLKPRMDMNDRALVMEEYLASLAEKRREALTPEERTVWRRFVRAIAHLWNRMVEAVSGRPSRMGMKEVEALLSALERHVMDGVQIATMNRLPRGEALASLDGDTKLFFYDSGILPSLRTDPDPTKTVTAYKLFRVRKDKPGKLFPLFVSADEAVDMGVWLDAEIGAATADGKVKSKLGGLAMRPGWHAGDAPVATHIGDKRDKADKAPSLRPENQVWAEIVAADDVDWQTEANRRTEHTKDGKPIARTAHITDQIPKDGLYRYKTNPNMTGTWIITGSMKVNRILSDAEVKRINKAKGIADLPRLKPFEAEKFGFDEALQEDGGEAIRASLRTLKDEGVAPGVRLLRKVLGRGVSEDVEDILSNPEMGKLVGKHDMSLWERLFKLPYWVAKDHPGFARVHDRQTRRVEERSTALKKSLEQVPLLYDPDQKKRLNKQEMAELNGMIWKWDGKEIPELKGVDKFIVKDKTLNGRDVLAHNPDFYPAYEKWLAKQPQSARTRQAFLQVRKSLDDDFLKAYTKMADMSDLADTDLEMYRTSFGNIPNYFPHQRKGKYYVTATTGKGVVGDPRITVFRKHFDVPLGSSVREEWAKIVATHKKAFPHATWHNPKEADKLPDEILGAPIDANAMEQIIKSATARLGNGDLAAEVQSVLLSGVSDVLKARGFGAHGIERQNIPGHDTENLIDVLYSYKAGLNGWLTKMEAASDFAVALGKIDAEKSAQLWGYASQYIKDMLRNSDRIDRVTGNIKTIAFAWYLGGNIKTAVVNLTQNFIIGIPRLQQYVTGGSGYWLKSAMDTVGLKYSTMGVSGAKNMKPDELQLIQELFGDGVINDAYMEEVRGQLDSAPGGKLWNTFVKWIGTPMSIVERFNRASLALAAYRAARVGAFRGTALKEFGLKKGDRMNYEQAKAFASRMVRDSHYVLDKGNQPEFFRSSVAGRMLSPAYTFRSFGANTLNLYYRALRSEGPEGMAFVAKSLGATMALGGLTAFPFYATMAALCQAVSGDGDDWTEEIRKALPESNLLRDVVCYGAPSMAGVSIGGSLRMETPMTGGFTKGSTPKEIFHESLGDLIGIPYDMLINRTSKVMESGANQSYDKMAEALLPVFVANMMQAWRLHTEGQTTKTGKPINDPGQKGARKLSASESVGKALGFQPVSSTKSFDAYAAQNRRDTVRSEKIGDLATAMLTARESDDVRGMVAARKEMREWNERMEREGKPMMRIKLADVQRRMVARRREAKATPKNREKGRAFAEVWGG